MLCSSEFGSLARQLGAVLSRALCIAGGFQARDSSHMCNGRFWAPSGVKVLGQVLRRLGSTQFTAKVGPTLSERCQTS